MSVGVGVAVVAAILVLLPLGAVWLAGRWRDPPRERWGIPQDQRELAAAALDVAELRIRQELRIRMSDAGTRSGGRWGGARRRRTISARLPCGMPEPRSRRSTPTAGHSMWGRRPPPRWVQVLLAGVGLAAVVFVLVNNPMLGAVYVLYGAGLVLFRSRWSLTRKRARAQAAVEANW